MDQPSSPLVEGPRAPELRTALFYATLFASPGVAAVYGGIWFERQGLSETQIGVLNAAPLFLVLILNLLVGRIADRARDWRQVIVAGALGGGLIPLALFWADGFWPILIVWALGNLSFSLVVPVTDAAAMRLTLRRGTNFGALRAWGTMGYMGAILATGLVVEFLGPDGFLPLFAGLALLRGLVALGLPPFRAPEGEVAPPRSGATRMSQLMQPWFLLPLGGFALLFATHLLLGAFQGILWEAQGYSVGAISVLVACTAVSETLMFFVFRRVVGRFSARHVLLVAALLTMLRWAAMALSPPLGVLVLLQLTHGLTYGMAFMAASAFIARWASEDIAAEAQSALFMGQQGMSVLVLVAFGGLFGALGEAAWWLACPLAGLAALAVVLSLRLMPPGARSPLQSPDLPA